tara:strand:+ start:35 stop:505 length:471 start_codon:yes stop_codon:yes gene_type:complete
MYKANSKKDSPNKVFDIWTLVFLLYAPLISILLASYLPKIEWSNPFESGKSRLLRQTLQAEKFGYPGIPYIANTGTSMKIFVNNEGIGFGECGWNFYCVPNELNTMKGVNYMPLNPPIKRIKKNVVRLDKSYFCNSFDIKGPGKCTSSGWKRGSER